MNAAATSLCADLPAGIQGLDIESGLAHMAGKKSLYIAMLRRFADSQAGAGRQIRVSLDSGDSETAHRIAHTLKSVSATVGAVDVRDRAAELECALGGSRSGESVSVLIDRLEQPLQGLVSALQHRL